MPEPSMTPALRNPGVLKAAQRLCRELQRYRIAVSLDITTDGRILSVHPDLTVWCDPGPEGLRYRWWTGRISERTGRAVFTLCRVDAPDVAARRIVERYSALMDQVRSVHIPDVAVFDHDAGRAGVGAVLSSKDLEVRHGYTVADLDELARQAAYRSRWRFQGFLERYELAWSVIAEQLCASVIPPTRYELIAHGEKTIWRQVVQNSAYRGVVIDHPERSQNGFMPRYYAYWQTHASPTPSHEGWIVDRLAFWQIWRRMGRRNRQVLWALAEYGDYDGAAKALRVSRKGFPTMLSLARQQFFRLWHEGETPSRFWGRGNRTASELYGGGGYKRAQRALKRRMNRRARANAKPDD
ncbi:hypothetical protein [Sphaerisporangium album]|uniref:hypothetical protein n=1 Tax=Sphaerisporangium album TaxID=509200 RepID=UPI0011C0524E|nr:hypothetical protein [Sphaerisporangium album]